MRRLVLPGLAIVISACGTPVPAPSGTLPPGADPGSRSGFAYRALTHVSWSNDEYGSGAGQLSREQLVSTRANWAGVLVTWYMDGVDSIAIAPDPLRTPTDAAVIQALADFHARGLRVMLKPHVDVQDGTWRGTIRPRDAGAWFESYDSFLARYATLGEANGVEMLCVGTELATMSDGRYAAEWGRIIAKTRASYHGRLTYAANAVGAGDEFTSVAFWPELDLAGLDAYTPLSDQTNPTRQELVEGWSLNSNGENMRAAFRNFQASLGKPVIFTELGYRSVEGSAQAPWDFQRNAAVDPEVQANCYEAAFEVWAQETSWFRGIFWWDWAVPAPSPQDTDYTPRGKPAEGVLATWQSP